jgi:hypothetical protein
LESYEYEAGNGSMMEKFSIGNRTW